MPTIKELESRGETGFEPEWSEYSGRAYRLRIKTKAGKKTTKTWFVGYWFETSYSCEAFLSRIYGQAIRGEIAPKLTDGDTELLIETTYKDFDQGSPISRIKVASTSRYPITQRQGRPYIQWSKKEWSKGTEARPAPSQNEILNAEISHGTKWHVFVWAGEGWRFVANLVDTAHKDALVQFLKKQGEEVYVAEKR